VFDEPLNGLDPEGILWVRGLLRRLAAQGRTVLLSSHLLSEVAHTVDDIVVISAGHLVTESPLADIAADGDDLENAFFHLVNHQSPQEALI
jgi:ABC-2 type transport system ATP-binding protein